MLKALAFGLGVGAAIQAWRAYPPSYPVTGDALAVVFCLGLVAAFLAGLWRSRGGATATATATAVATASNVNRVQLAVVMPGQGARAQGVRIPSDQAPWLAGTEVRPEITADDLDGMDLSELFPEQEDSTQ